MPLSNQKSTSSKSNLNFHSLYCDSTLIFTLLLGAALVGVGFNIKMLQAYLPLPAFYGLYLLSSRERLGRKAGKLFLAAALLLAISLSWALAVDLTPASQRPYVGSSGDNSEMSLILGYNGLNRLVGMAGPGGAGGGNAGVGQLQPPGGTNNSVPQPAPGMDGGFPLPGPADGGFGDGRGQFPGPGGQASGSGFMNTGQPGILRLFVSPLSKEVIWLLPFGILSMLLLALRNRLRWPLDEEHQALVLWGGWLLTGAVFFSVAGFFHPYYLSMLAVPLAALVAIGVAGLWHLRARRPWLAISLLTAGNASTADLDTTFQQIQDAMTTEQVQTIQSMDLSGQNMPALAQKLGITMPAGQPPAGTPGPAGLGGFPGAQGMGGNGTPPAAGMGSGFETTFYQAVIDLLQQKIQ